MCGHLPAITKSFGTVGVKAKGSVRGGVVTSRNMEGPLEVNHESLFGVWVDSHLQGPTQGLTAHGDR